MSLTKWSQLKGTNVVGTGDFTHPRWFEELQEKLEPSDTEPGLFRLKAKYEREMKLVHGDVPERCRVPMRFMLTVEISTIYKKNGRVRKVHSCIFASSFEAVAALNTRLAAIGNIHSDGRPILGLDTRELLAITLDVSSKLRDKSVGECFFVPAHIWTPHFSVFGSQSGFDTLQECFGELTPHIFAVETGLSSDPPMNWRIAELDNRAIISNSDAHSAGKLGREANIFDTEMSYPAIINALKTNDHRAFRGTIEFYPEEGKYHMDGHRACGVCWTPDETQRANGICLKCGRPVTVGVMHRVEKLADPKRGADFCAKQKSRSGSGNIRPYHSIVPLPEMIAEVEGVGPKSKRVQAKYMDMLTRLGNEFHILLDEPLDRIESEAGILMTHAIKRMREGTIFIEPGYDGEFGVVKIFKPGEKLELVHQGSLL